MNLNHLMDGPDLKPLDKPCGDCAVVCGFYRPYADAVLAMPRADQIAVARKWDCHNCRRACRGMIDKLSPEVRAEVLQ